MMPATSLWTCRVDQGDRGAVAVAEQNRPADLEPLENCRQPERASSCI